MMLFMSWTGKSFLAQGIKNDHEFLFTVVNLGLGCNINLRKFLD